MDSTFGMREPSVAELQRRIRNMNPPQTGCYKVGDKVLVRSNYYGCTISTEIIARYDDGKYDVRTPRSKWNMADRSSFERIGEDRIIKKL